MFQLSGFYPSTVLPLQGQPQWNSKKQAYPFNKHGTHKKRPTLKLGRALGHFIFSLIGLKRILVTNIFKAFKAPPRTDNLLNPPLSTKAPLNKDSKSEMP